MCRILSSLRHTMGPLGGRPSRQQQHTHAEPLAMRRDLCCMLELAIVVSRETTPPVLTCQRLKGSLVIYHLTFLICHLIATRRTQESTDAFLKMTNDKCQMIYDQ